MPASPSDPNPNPNPHHNPYPNQVPRFLQPPLTAAHADIPFGCTTAVRARLTQLVKRGLDLGSELWRALQARDHAALKTFHQRLDAHSASHQLELLAKWRLRDGDGAVLARDESSAPYGETLAHACGYYGATTLLGRLLGTSSEADLARRRGVASGFTALHAAVAGGHVDACKLLLEAGARPATASAARRSAIWTACVKGHREVSDAAAALCALGCSLVCGRLQPCA